MYSHNCYCNHKTDFVKNLEGFDLFVSGHFIFKNRRYETNVKSELLC